MFVEALGCTFAMPDLSRAKRIRCEGQAIQTAILIVLFAAVPDTLAPAGTADLGTPVLPTVVLPRARPHGLTEKWLRRSLHACLNCSASWEAIYLLTSR